MTRMRKSRVLSLSLLLAAGCGSDAPNPNPSEAVDAGAADGSTSADIVTFSSGTRLKANYDEGGGGAQRLRHWLDTSLDITCSFAVDENWAYRCMPDKQHFQLSFSDSACTVPVLSVAGVDGQKHVSHVLPKRCNGRFRVQGYRVQEETVVLAQTFVVRDGNCVGDGSLDEYRRLEKVDAEIYAEGIPEVVIANSELAAVVVKTADGAQEAIAIAEASTGTRCSISGGPRSEERFCIPGEPAFATGARFTDGCTEVIASSSQVEQCTPEFVQANETKDAQGCSELVLTVHSVGSPVLWEDVFKIGGNAICVAAGESNQSFWEVGAQVERAFPRVKKAQVGTGDIRLVYDATETSTALLARDEWQLADGTPCNLYTTTENKSRCIPGEGEVVQETVYWADAECTGQQLVRSLEVCGKDWAPRTFYVKTEPVLSQQAKVLEVRSVGTEYLSENVYKMGGQGCMPHIEAEGSHTAHFQEIGVSVPLSEFPEVLRVQD